MDFNEDCLINSVLVFVWLEWIWEFHICRRQLNIYKTKTEVPRDLKDMISEESFKKGRLYGMDKLQFKVLRSFVSAIINSIILYRRWSYIAWQKSEEIGSYIGISADREIIISCIFMIILVLFSVATSLPFSYYHAFVIEERHGFNKQTIGFFIKDQLKAILLSVVLILPFTAAGIQIIMLGGDMFVIWLWLFATVFTIVLVTIYPSVIAPLFDTFVPLPDGPLREGIHKLAEKVKFSLSQIYVVEGSKRSAHSNAYFGGMFGAKRIVLFDTLIEKHDEVNNKKTGCTNTEILGVLAHEIGHWTLKHVYVNLIVSEVNLFLLFSAFGLLFKYSLLYTALGFPPGQEPIIIGIMVILQLVLAPYNAMLSFAMTCLSRYNEFQADNYAGYLGYASELKSALMKLGKDNLDYPIYDNLYSTWYHTHPPLMHRLENIDKKFGAKKTD